jgi:hypothetical protein
VILLARRYDKTCNVYRLGDSDRGASVTCTDGLPPDHSTLEDGTAGALAEVVAFIIVGNIRSLAELPWWPPLVGQTLACPRQNYAR